MGNSTWDHFGRHDPYYGVLSTQEYRNDRMDAAARSRFFATGERQVDQLLQLCNSTLGPVKTGRALDYGCGVGRLTRALASRFGAVVAVDISEPMLAEARRNLADRDNVSFERAEAMGNDEVDFVISRIVIQHIPAQHGLTVLRRLASRLAPGGVGVIDVPIAYTGGVVRGFLRKARERWPFGEPNMPMHVYRRAEVEEALRAGGVASMATQIVQVPRFEKAIVVFRR